MELQELDQIGEKLRGLGHERREVVERIVSEMERKETGAVGPLYRQLDQISERCIDLMQHQRNLIRDRVAD